MESAIRQKLHDAYMELAEQATVRRQWEAASAFQYAAGLALGLTVKVEVAPQQPRCICTAPLLAGFDDGRCCRCGAHVAS